MQQHMHLGGAGGKGQGRRVRQVVARWNAGHMRAREICVCIFMWLPLPNALCRATKCTNCHASVCLPQGTVQRYCSASAPKTDTY